MMYNKTNLPKQEIIHHLSFFIYSLLTSVLMNKMSI